MTAPKKNAVIGSENAVTGSASDSSSDSTEKNAVTDRPLKNMANDSNDSNDSIFRTFPSYKNGELEMAKDSTDSTSGNCPKYEGEDSDVLEAAEKETEAKRWARRLY